MQSGEAESRRTSTQKERPRTACTLVWLRQPGARLRTSAQSGEAESERTPTQKERPRTTCAQLYRCGRGGDRWFSRLCIARMGREADWRIREIFLYDNPCFFDTRLFEIDPRSNVLPVTFTLNYDISIVRSYHGNLNIFSRRNNNGNIIYEE